jgi:two-component system OmpR family response regulator
LRAAGNTVPVIITTAQDQVAIRIEGLNAGADDYLVKPFDLAEMSARIAAVARRYGGNPIPTVVAAGVAVDLAQRKIKVDGKPVSLTAREWAVLERLLSRRGAIVTKAEIEDSLYAFGAEIESNAVEVYISRLRKVRAVMRAPAKPPSKNKPSASDFEQSVDCEWDHGQTMHCSSP